MTARNPKPLAAKALYQDCDLKQFEFKTTAEIEPLDQSPGQERALQAIEFGVDIKQARFNLFVVGHSGLGKERLIRQILSRHAPKQESHWDWCYVNNFDNPQKPKLLKLPAGTGQKLRQDMASLVEDLLTALPSSFQSEEYRTRRQEIEQELQNRQEDAFRKLDQDAAAKGIVIMRTPTGYTMGPAVEGRPLGPDEYARLSDEEKQRIEKIITELQLELQDIIRQMPLVQREHYQRIKALNEEITRHTVEQLIAWIENNYRDQATVMDYLQAVKEHAIKNVDAFLPDEREGETGNLSSRVAQFYAYSVNVLVDNSETRGAPIVFEDHPTYQNLTGRVEHLAQMGTLVTNFTLIKPGALHRANGGYLVLDALKLLSHGFAWEGLKRALKSREIRIQSLDQMLSLTNTVSLEPEPVPIDIKVILTGEPRVYYLLKQLDHEFGQLFKVMADFATSMDREPDNVQRYARTITAIQQECEARPLDRASVGRLIEVASREADDGEKLSLDLEGLRDLLCEANYWCGKAEKGVIRLEDVEKALGQRDYRRDRYRELMQEQILRGIKLIDTEGERIAQVNALSVLQVGGYRFGQVSRVTATARLGRPGVVDIEREASLGGDIHTKGVMILSAYLASRYAANQPLPLAASLAFEQSYGKIDGDSASAAELCALLSALGEFPLRQSLAITGSINQLGEVQAIGGANEKIEAFFRVCEARGLSGEQGVIIPAANREHLMLDKAVRDAVRQKQFRIYAVETVDEVMQLLSGLKPGSADAQGHYPKTSFNGRIQQRIGSLQKVQARFAKRSSEPGAAAENPSA